MRTLLRISYPRKRFLHVALRQLLAAAAIFSILHLAGCCDDCDDPVIVATPPAVPSGVYSITGDGYVEINWNANTESDLEGYDIFWSDAYDGDFDYMVSVPRSRTYFVDNDVENGVTYFYKLRAYNRADQVSQFSEVIFDTPRPAGAGLVLRDYLLGQNAGVSGYDFSRFTVQAWDNPSTDVYFGSPNGIPTLFGKGTSIGDGVDVQDYGYIELDWVDWAPDIEEGWSPSKRVEMIPGHSYVVQMLNKSDDFYYYAKVYCQSVDSDLVVLDWAYQESPGNPELTPERGGAR
jgi:hypothetical protein